MCLIIAQVPMRVNLRSRRLALSMEKARCKSKRKLGTDQMQAKGSTQYFILERDHMPYLRLCGSVDRIRWASSNSPCGSVRKTSLFLSTETTLIIRSL
jgi:hypothetical protein